MVLMITTMVCSFRWVVGGEACRSAGEFRPNSQRQRISRGNRSAYIYQGCANISVTDHSSSSKATDVLPRDVIKCFRSS